jgi:signal transduction histidine kinase
MSKLSIAEEQERRRISEHIHDNISQNLAISKMNIETLQEEFPPAARKLKETQELIEQTIKFIRSLTFELSPPILYELGFVAAVEWLTDKVQERYGIIIEFKSDSRFKTLKGEISVLLFRTIRELLNNIIKHSRANNAIVSILGYGDYMEIRVEDDGVGFDAKEINDYIINGESFGIASIRERISYLNGFFEISSRPGEGTKVRMIVPLHQ